MGSRKVAQKTRGLTKEDSMDLVNDETMGFNTESVGLYLFAQAFIHQVALFLAFLWSKPKGGVVEYCGREGDEAFSWRVALISFALHQTVALLCMVYLSFRPKVFLSSVGICRYSLIAPYLIMIVGMTRVWFQEENVMLRLALEFGIVTAYFVFEASVSVFDMTWKTSAFFVACLGLGVGVVQFPRIWFEKEPFPCMFDTISLSMSLLGIAPSSAIILVHAQERSSSEVYAFASIVLFGLGVLSLLTLNFGCGEMNSAAARVVWHLLSACSMGCMFLFRMESKFNKA